MPIEFSLDWEKVHEVIDWSNSIGWAFFLAYEAQNRFKIFGKRETIRIEDSCCTHRRKAGD